MRTLVLVLFACIAGCSEPGFMAVRPHWTPEEMPLAVCVRTYSTGGAYTDEGAKKITGDVLDTMNSRLGFKLYSLAETNCDVIATIGVPVEAGWHDRGGDAVVYQRLSGTRCSITTANTGSDEILFYVIEHELGHCAGLDHDDWDGSIMRRSQRERGDLEFAPWISDSDRALLRQTYLR